MTKLRIAVGVLAVSAAVALAADGTAAEKALKSGPQVGEQVPGPFHPLNVTGANAGEKFCLYCKNGTNPVAMVFARDLSDPLVTLIKRLDKCTAKNSGCNMGSFVVFLNDDEDLQKRVKEAAEKSGIQHTVLAVDNPAGPKRYNVSKDADVTVVLYTDHVVKANYAFEKGQLSEKDVERIVADVAKITPKE